MAILINVTDAKAEGVYRPPLSVYDRFYSFDAMRHYLCRGYATDSPGHASEAQCAISLRVSIKDGTGRSFEHDLDTQLVHFMLPYISLLSYIPSYLTYSARVLINTIEAETKLGNTGIGRNEELFFTIAIGQPIYAPERLPQFGIYSSFRLFELYLETINNAGYFMLPTLRSPFRIRIETTTYPTPFSLTM